MTGRIRILIAESARFSRTALEILSGVGEVTSGDLDRAGLESRIAGTGVLWVRLAHQIDAGLLAAAPDLKVIVSPTTGLNHIDQRAADSRGIAVLSLKGETEFLNGVRATAEHTIGLMLALLRHVPAAARHVKEGGWNRDLFIGNELFGKTVGILGYGRLGRIVSRYLHAFDAKVLACDPLLHEHQFDAQVTPVPLGRLLKESDIVSMHVPLNETTRAFFGEKEFAAMKPGAWFINTARGELIDEDALVFNLRLGRLAGAALDVIADEASHIRHRAIIRYARQRENLIITPHLGGGTVESMEKTEIFMARKLRGFLSLQRDSEVLAATAASE